jgi:hypothetical protein
LQERRIRYPVGGESDEEGAWGGAAAAATAPPRAPPAPAPAAPAPAAPATPASPAALARLAADAAAAAADADVRLSFSVLEGCPWPAPRALFLLLAPSTATDGGDDAPSPAFVMRVRRRDEGVASELASLLGRARCAPPPIACSSLVDGVLAFTDESDAAAFADALGSGRAAGLARAVSHDVFRFAAAASAVVVLVAPPTGTPVPDPGALAAALRAGGGGDGW